MASDWRASVVIAACLAAACRAEPRAAICFYGLTRSLPYTIDTIRSNIFDPLIEDEISYSVFLHTYNVAEVHTLCRTYMELCMDPMQNFQAVLIITVTQINNPNSGENHVVVDWRAFRRLQPTAVEVEDADAVFKHEYTERFASLLQYEDPWDAPHNTILRNLVLQLHSLKKVADLHEVAAREHGPFDVIIALRSDLWVFNRISIEDIRAAMRWNATIFTPALDTRGGLNDELAFGHPDAMKRVMHRLDEAFPSSEQTPSQSEIFLKYVVDRNGLNTVDTDIVIERVRGNGFLHQIPEFHKRGGLASCKPGKWIRRSRLAMWELSAIPTGFAGLDSIMQTVATQERNWSV